MAFPNPFKREPTSTPSSSTSRVEPHFEGNGTPAPENNDSPWTVSPDDGRFGTSAQPPLSVPASVPPQQSAKPAADVPPVTTPSATTPHVEELAPVREPLTKAVEEEPRAPQTPQASPAPEQKTEPAKKPFFASWGKTKSEEHGIVPSDQELLLRQKTRNRLVGAAALLMAAVIIAPLFLDSEEALEEPKVSTEVPAVTEAQRVEVPMEATAPKTADAQSADQKDDNQEATKPAATPQAGGAVARVNVSPDMVSDQNTQPDATARVQAAVSAQKAKVERAAAEERQKAQQTQQAKKPAAEEAAPSAAAPSEKGYFVQVLAIGNEAKADAAVKRMRDHGLPAYKMKVQGRNLWRVRVGVFKSREQANSAIGKLALIGYTDKLSPEQQ